MSTYELNQAADGMKTAAAAVAEASEGAVGGIVALTADQTRAMKVLNEEIRRGGSYMTLSLQDAQFILQQLGGMLGAGEQVLRQRIEELSQAAERAKQVAQDMADQAADLQDQIDQELGKQDDIEERRHEKKLADLEAEAKENGRFGSAEYLNLVQLENQLHDIKMKHIREQQQASKNSGGGGSGDGSGLPTGAGTLPTPARGDQAQLKPTFVVQNVDAGALAKALAQYQSNHPGMTPEQIAQSFLDQLRKHAAASGISGIR